MPCGQNKYDYSVWTQLIAAVCCIIIGIIPNTNNYVMHLSIRRNVLTSHLMYNLSVFDASICSNKCRIVKISSSSASGLSWLMPVYCIMNMIYMHIQVTIGHIQLCPIVRPFIVSKRCIHPFTVIQFDKNCDCVSEFIQRKMVNNWFYS